MDNIYEALEGDINTVYSIIHDAATKLAEEGNSDLLDYYTIERVKSKFETGQFLVLYEEDTPVGTISISNSPPSYFAPEDMNKFEDPFAKASYIGSLAVRPEFQGKGYAKALLNSAERIVHDRDIEYVRLDAKQSDNRLLKLYLNRGYVSRGIMSPPEDEYLLLEKDLSERM